MTHTTTQGVTLRQKPFRVIVWGPGRLGAICIREISLTDVDALLAIDCDAIICHVQIQENWDVGAFGVDTLKVIGFGQQREAVEANTDSLSTVEQASGDQLWIRQRPGQRCRRRSQATQVGTERHDAVGFTHAPEESISFAVPG